MELDFDKPLKTKSGLKVRVFDTEYGNERYPIAGAYYTADGWTLCQWTAAGKYFSCEQEHVLDLVQVEEPKQLVVIILGVWDEDEKVWTQTLTDLHPDLEQYEIPTTLPNHRIVRTIRLGRNIRA